MLFCVSPLFSVLCSVIGKTVGSAFAGIFVLATILGYCWIRRPPSTTCACCTPLWKITYSVPLACWMGKAKAKSEWQAFTIVPDMILQIPIALVVELAPAVFCCRGDFCSD